MKDNSCPESKGKSVKIFEKRYDIFVCIKHPTECKNMSHESGCLGKIVTSGDQEKIVDFRQSRR